VTRRAHVARFVLAFALAAGACGGSSGDDKGNADASTSDAMVVTPPDASPPDAPPLPPDADTSDLCHGVTQHCLDGTTLEVCDTGALVTTDCGAQSQICQSDGVGGFECADPPVPGANTVFGKVEYEDRAPQPDGKLGTVHTLPSRGVTVSVVKDQGNMVLATGRTADDGTYSLSYDTPAGTMVHVLAATTSDLPTRPVKCVKSNNAVHGLASASFAAAVGTTQNILAKQAGSLAQPFNVFDQLITGIDTVHLRMGASTLSPIVAHWQIGDTDGTYYNGSLNLLGVINGDDDGNDDAVILHEFGHYVEDVYGQSDSPGGSHSGERVDPRLGWSEGWATYFSSAARGISFYADSMNAGAAGFGDDLEHTVFPDQDPNGPMTQTVSEETVAEVLWDIGDGQANDDDPRAGGDRHEDVMKVQTEYLHSGVTATRGVSGIDFVDFLDGWFKLRGTSTCAALRTIVVTVHKFPYDFNAPGAACP
jgi:hypothetical protein